LSWTAEGFWIDIYGNGASTGKFSLNNTIVFIDKRDSRDLTWVSANVDALSG